MPLHNVIDEAVQNIQFLDSKRRRAVEQLSFLKSKNLSDFSSKELLEEKLVFPAEKAPLEGRIAGVDSGFVGKNLFSMDLLIIRGVAAIFDYKGGKLVSSSYLPDFFSFPEPILSNNALEKDEFQCNKSIQRLLEEIRLSKETIEKFSPKFLFIDGSIIPQYADKPRKDSKIESAYHKLISAFQDLYSVAEKKNCELIATVEDSRGSRFRSILQEEILCKEKACAPENFDDCFDSVLLDYLLAQGERSFAFKYTSKISEHPILNDFDSKWADSIHAFYLKPSAFDRPLRIEFISREKGSALSEHANKIASITFAQSSLNREYAYPAVLIEADMRARLAPDEIEIIYNKIIDKLGKNFKLKLRRDNRPFK